MKKELLICENNNEQAINLFSLINSYNLDLEIKLFLNPEDLIQYISRNNNTYIVLMDIMLNDDISGIDIAAKIHIIYPEIPIIFISAYLEKACDVYEVDHCYFVYKPQKEEKLKKALDKAIYILDKKPFQILLHEKQNLVLLNLKDILCIERIRRATFITTIKQVYQVQESLNDLKEMLPDCFNQCHRNYMVNFSHIRKIKSTELELKNGIKVPVSRRMYTNISNHFQEWLSEADEIV